MFLREVALQDRFESFARGVILLRHSLYFAGLSAIGFTFSLVSMQLARAR